MRELAATGFMSNRGRQVCTVEYHKLSEKVQLHYWQLFLKPIWIHLINGSNFSFVFLSQNVASFLTKDLHLDWRLGAEWFESMLVMNEAFKDSNLWWFSEFFFFTVWNTCNGKLIISSWIMMCAVTMVTGYTAQELEMILEKTGSSMLLNRDLIMIVRSEFPSWNPKARHVDFYYQ